MGRLELKIPASDVNEARDMGATWDSYNKIWYVPNKIPHERFSKWERLSKEDTGTLWVLTREYLVAQAYSQCWKCMNTTTVYAIPLIYPNFDLEPAGDNEDESFEDECCTISDSGHSFYMCYTKFITESFARSISEISNNHYCVDYSKTSGFSYWMNHCDKCGAKIGDFNLLNDGGAFDVLSEEQARKILLREVSATYMEATFDDLSSPILFLGSMPFQPLT